MNRTKLLGAVLGVVVIVAVPSALPIPSASSLREETASLRGENDATRQKIETTTTYEADPAFPEKRLIAEGHVPSGPDLPGLIDQLDEAARSSGFRWTAGTPQPSTPTSGAEHVWTMTMNLEGSVSGISDLLDRLSTLRRLVTVDSVNVQRSQGNEATASLVVRFYALNATDAIPTTEVK